MTGVWITLALGAIIMIFDYRAETRPDEKDKLKRPRKLSKQAKDNLRQLFFGTIVAAGAVWVIGQMWE
ncbi:MAG: hypothetical protein EBT83_03120 [Betaproteobacteria bacterium]|nr:hypothetical protein [Betaproteobacteria bacterium]